MKYVEIKKHDDWTKVFEITEKDLERELIQVSERWLSHMRKELIKHKDRGVSWPLAKSEVLKKMIKRQLDRFFGDPKQIFNYSETAADISNLLFMYADLEEKTYDVKILPVSEKER